MKTAAELRAEADHLRAIARRVADRSLIEKIVELADELERRALEVDDDDV
jgi:hypothetical protein